MTVLVDTFKPVYVEASVEICFDDQMIFFEARAASRIEDIAADYF